MEEKISQAVIRRLPKYYRYLQEAEAANVDKVSSSKMSADMGLNASQIRRDLNCFGGFGQQGYGYSVSKLKKEIAGILGLNKRYKVIIIGAGRIGQALMGYSNFAGEGFQMVAIFDIAPNKIGIEVAGETVRDIAELFEFVSNNPVDIAIICTAKESAQKAADDLVSYGIKAIWNFAPVDIAVGRDVAVENVHLSDSLYVLSFQYNH